MKQQTTDSRQWRRFTVEVALIRSPPSSLEAAVSDVEEELNQRQHLKIVDVAWDTQGQQISIKVKAEGFDAQQTADGVAEEIFEMAAAVLPTFDAYRVEILSVNPAA
jgi:hypothetical protein